MFSLLLPRTRKPKTFNFRNTLLVNELIFRLRANNAVRLARERLYFEVFEIERTIEILVQNLAIWIAKLTR